MFQLPTPSTFSAKVGTDVATYHINGKEFCPGSDGERCILIGSAPKGSLSHLVKLSDVELMQQTKGLFGINCMDKIDKPFGLYSSVTITGDDSAVHFSPENTKGKGLFLIVPIRDMQDCGLHGMFAVYQEETNWQPRYSVYADQPEYTHVQQGFSLLLEEEVTPKLYAVPAESRMVRIKGIDVPTEKLYPVVQQLTIEEMKEFVKLCDLADSHSPSRAVYCKNIAQLLEKAQRTPIVRPKPTEMEF